MTANREPTRVVGDSVSIDYADTLSFFEGRAERATSQPLLTTVLYQDQNPDLAAERDAHEWELVKGWLDLSARPRVVDIGCGVGRWGVHLAPYLTSYQGVDFSPGLVDLARENLAPHITKADWSVDVGSAAEIGQISLPVPGPFDLVVIAGVLVYLNDADVQRVFDALPELAAARATIFLREPIAMSKRLTLRQHWSDDLGQSYSAVYRHSDDYRHLAASILEPAGFDLIADQPMAERLRNRSETSQHYFVMSRR